MVVGGMGEEMDRIAREVLFTSVFPPSMEVLYEVVDDNVRAYLWRWRYGGRVIYGLNVRVCDNNVLALRSLDEGAIDKWSSMLGDIIEFMKKATAQCLSSP